MCEKYREKGVIAGIILATGIALQDGKKIAYCEF